jgi:transcriptional regulator with XRE-family HTH domain
MPEIYEYIGQKIRELRGSISQEVLGEKIGVSGNTVSRWETGTYKPTPEDLDKLARFFKVSITVFFPDLKPNEGRVAALASATGGLADRDFEEVIRFAEFRRARRALEASKRARSKR